MHAACCNAAADTFNLWPLPALVKSVDLDVGDHGTQI